MPDLKRYRVPVNVFVDALSPRGASDIVIARLRAKMESGELRFAGLESDSSLVTEAELMDGVMQNVADTGMPDAKTI